MSRVADRIRLPRSFRRQNNHDHGVQSDVGKTISFKYFSRSFSGSSNLYFHLKFVNPERMQCWTAKY